ncbi:vesicle transport protein SEC20-like protein [Aphelenchoides avenae]|nr:vesicle transport protein SEC20-like protein [Aphelenchus avenae]
MRRRNVRANTQMEAAQREQKMREELLGKTLPRQSLYSTARRSDAIFEEATKTTDSLAALVQRMSDQVRQSEDTTSTLIHSSAQLRDTQVQFGAVGATIRSGGKLISKFARRETTDKILIALALTLYFGVVFYILRKRVFYSWF